MAQKERHPLQRNGRPARYNVDIGDLHSLCEANYLRLLQVFPGYETCNDHALAVGPLLLDFEVGERCRFTTLLRLNQRSQPGLPALKLDIRLYHDARMAEIVAFQRARHLAGRYEYPNPNMYQRDEKAQQNRYLAELLALCLAEGRLTDTVSLWAQHES